VSNQRAKLSPEEQQKRLSEYRQKKLEVEEAELELRHQRVVRAKTEAQDLEKLSLDIDDSYAKKLQEKNDKKFKSSEKKMQLIYGVPELSVPVPFYAGEMILFGARTGTGKTTACVNIAYSMIRQGKKPIVITNEESAEDFLNRLASLFMEKRYGNLEKIDAETKERLQKMIPGLLKYVRVIDADFAKMKGLNLERLTNSIEGLKFIETKLLEEAEQGKVFDAIIIDYYQKFNFSIKMPMMRTYECQEIAASIIENLRVNYPAPIVVFSQMDDGKEDEDGSSAPFETRIQGRKIIANYATVVFEIKADRENSTTEFKLHKGRNMEYVRGKIIAGWDNGKYVRFDEEFKKKIAQRKLEALKKKEGITDENSNTSGIEEIIKIPKENPRL
jgi:replicative DNA helicase